MRRWCDRYACAGVLVVGIGSAPGGLCYASKAGACVELERRSTILQRSPHGAAYASAWKRYMGAIDARDYAVKVLRQNYFHVSD